MAYDRSTVEKAVQLYFDGLYEGDADKLGAVFHPSADLRWQDKGDLKVMPVPDWLAWVKEQKEAMLGLIGIWKTDHPPSDEEVERILEEARMKKYG